MKKIVNSLIALLAAACILTVLNIGLENMGAINEDKVLVSTMQSMLPDSHSFMEEPYTGEDAAIVKAWKGETGFIVETKTYGYAGDITMLIGVSNEGSVTGLVVKDMEETMGLGAKALTDWRFLMQFLNTTGNVAIETAGADAFSSATGRDSAENETYVDGITGATVTSKAIARSVNSAVGYVTGADAQSSATSWGG